MTLQALIFDVDGTLADRLLTALDTDSTPTLATLANADRVARQEVSRWNSRSTQTATT